MNTQTPTAPVAASTASQTQEIMDALKTKAMKLLGNANNVNLEGFHAGSMGQFPFYYTDPSSLLFNQKTYDWIKSALATRTKGEDISLSGVFTNEFVTAISAISYNLSTTDTVKLNKAAKAATAQQMALLQAWQAAYGSLPTPVEGNTAVDQVITIIRTKWTTNPKVTLAQLQTAKNLSQLLGNAPASAGPIIPVFANYLSAWGASLSLLDSLTLNRAILADIKNAVLTASAANGGIQTNQGSTYHPAYPVATPQATILNALGSTSNAIDLDMTVSQSSTSDVSVSISGGASFSLPVLDFLTIGASGHASSSFSAILKQSSSIDVNMKFTGVNVVSFGPMEYDISSTTGWFDSTPIVQAIANQGQDVTGYKFSTPVQIDFSKLGPFGYLDAVGISNFPTITIKITSSNYQSFQSAFNAGSSWSVGFLGIPLGGSASQNYSASSQIDKSQSNTIIVTLSPPQNVVATTATDSTAFVLGVQPVYPGV